ncbi:DEAD/DEAH box helicase [Undibacterium sp.]|uniref:DEAD/DEAH box helicase n=1 Tax=Undibacterium sp. TaxID=1914977 RepID=UPI0025FABD81|nr:DEAD/DEAH box helicase [Undibacterium sp.]
MSEQDSSSFDILDARIQRWIWAEGWTELRDAQERAIPALVSADHDVIIAAATAAGKTEAAFLPILTNMLGSDEEHGLCLYISPLKALINDQFGRLERLCDSLEIAVWPWHGDISSSSKTRFFKQPSGILLITPESLEAMLCNRGFQIPKIFASLRYIVVDELHAFIGSERGKQLQSLMLRINLAVGRKVPRVGLSATLGDMRLAAEFLQPRGGSGVEIIESASKGGELKILIKGYVDSAPRQENPSDTEDSATENSITHHLFQSLRGSNNLVFPNSRAKVEQYTYKLRRMCEAANVPNEFWPHHGSLSREIREETEAALKNKELHTTAICTNTLELGIDIGAVKSIAQIGPPPSVASLRQRLGRSGRRKGEPAILRGYVIEQELNDKSHVMTELREELFEITAMVSLLLEGWFEPPKTDGLHLSTFVQQLLSLIAQKGGISASDAYRTLCEVGPFDSIQKNDFIELLRHLGKSELIQQDPSGLLLHGAKGELQVNHYTFYAAFASEEEFRVVSSNKTLGSLPISSSISVGDYILFAARTWTVEEIDEKGKTIFVTKTASGRAPSFNGAGGRVHDKVRARMRELYQTNIPIPFLDSTATRLMTEGRNCYARYSLDNRALLSLGGSQLLFTWLGDKANEALASMLKLKGFSAAVVGPAIEIVGAHTTTEPILDCLFKLAENIPLDPEALLIKSFNLQQEKWDWALPEGLLRKSFASLHLDINAAHNWLVTNSKFLKVTI